MIRGRQSIVGPFGNLSAMMIERPLDPSHNGRVCVVAGSHVNDGMGGKSHIQKRQRTSQQHQC